MLRVVARATRQRQKWEHVIPSEESSRRKVEKDIKRYSSILEMYNSRTLKTGNVEGRNDLIDKTGQVARHLENIIRGTACPLEGWVSHR